MLGQELAARRKSLRLTQAELAQRLGVTVTTVSRWEIGQRTIPLMARRMLEYIEQDLRDEWAALSPEEQYRRNKARIDAEFGDAPSGGRVPSVADVLQEMQRTGCSQDEAVRRLGGTP